MLSLTAVLFCANLSAQENSPYTRFGVGELSNGNFANTIATGGLSSAFNSTNQLNFSNPASYGFLTKTSFNIGIKGSSLHITKDDSSATFGNGQLNYLALGFPVIKGKWGFSFGLIPFSQVNYNLLQLNDSVEGIGPSYNSYKGTGALYRWYVGTGFHWKNIAAGLNAQYLFGSINYSNLQVFTGDSVNTFNTRKLESKSIGDILIDGGIQVNIPISKQTDNTFKYNLCIGINGSNSQKINVTDRILMDRFVFHTITTGYTTAIYKDTILIDTVKGIMNLPMHYDAGVRFTSEGKFSIGMNYSFGKWSDYSFLNETDPSSINFSRWSVGGEIIPKSDNDENYLNLIRYRAGFYTGQSNQQFSGIALKETGITFGAGFPFLYRTSYNTKVVSEISVAFEIGMRGTTENHLIKENYFKGTIGFSLTDLWFVKRKFD